MDMELGHYLKIWYLFTGFKTMIFCSVGSMWFMKYKFSAKIWFVETSTRIVKYESQVIKSSPGYHHFTQVCYKWKSYYVWFLRCEEHNRHNFLSFSIIFGSFYTSVPKIMIICYTVPEIWHVTEVIIIFHFRLF